LGLRICALDGGVNYDHRACVVGIAMEERQEGKDALS
jgi:hypothetical protein